MLLANTSKHWLHHHIKIQKFLFKCSNARPRKICFPFSLTENLRTQLGENNLVSCVWESFIHQPMLSDLCWVSEVVIQSYLIYTHTSSSCEQNKDNFQSRSFKFYCAFVLDLLSILFCVVWHGLRSCGHCLCNNRYNN